MKSRHAISMISLLTLLSACTFVPLETPPSDPAVTWIMLPRPALVIMAASYGTPLLDDAFTVRHSSTSCTIYSTIPETWQIALKTWLHEARHCREGAFH